MVSPSDSNQSNLRFGFEEVLLITIALTLFAVLSVVGYQALTDLNTDIQSDSDVSNSSKEAVADLETRYPRTLDSAFVIVLGLLLVLGVVGAFVADSHPAMLIIMVILFVMLLMAGAVMSNTWEEFTDDAELSSFSNSFPMTDYILNNFLLILGGAGLLIGLGLYAKNRIG